MSNFAYAFFLLSPQQRKALKAFYGFCRAVDDITDGQLSPFVATEALDEWRQEIDRLYQGYPTKPDSMALMDLIDEYPIPAQYFHDIIDGVSMDLTIHQYETFEELRLYCYKVASVVGLVAIEIFGYQSPHSKTFAIKLGQALQLTNIIRDVGEDIDRDRLYLPLEDLARFEVSKQDIQAKRNTPAFQSLMRFEANRAWQWYEKAWEALPAIDRSQLVSGVAMGNIYQALLEKIIDKKFPVLKRRVKLCSLQKIWIVLKSAWQCRSF